MKITRVKLNAMLRSGLCPAVTTRKQLAAHLNIDPTSVTRWFAPTDSAGNPRYPVVPDRHVAAVLQLFGLEPNQLTLPDDAFRQFCFEQALAKNTASADAKTTLTGSSPLPRSERGWAWKIGAVAIAMLIAVALTIALLPTDRNTLEQSIADNVQAIFNRGEGNLQAQQFRAAIDDFATVAEQFAAMGKDQSALARQALFNQGLALYGLGDWQRARLHFQLEKPSLVQGQDVMVSHETAEGARGAARGQIELGNAFLAFGYIQGAIEHDRQHLGDDHPTMADNWLLLSQILYLQNNLQEARRFAEQALQLDRRLFGAAHPRVAEDKMTLALIALQEGEISRAHDLFADALDNWRAAGLGLNTPGRPEGLIHSCLQTFNDSYRYANQAEVAVLLQHLFTELDNAVTANEPFVLKRLAIVLRHVAVSRQYL